MATVLYGVAGLGYTLLWASLAHHGWHSYSDLWNSAGIAQSVGHGHWAAVYAAPSQLDAPPGFEFLKLVRLAHPCTVVVPGRSVPHQG